MLRAGFEPAQNLSSDWCNSDNHFTTTPTLESEEYLKNLKQYKCFACNQIREGKRKSGAYEVASRVETEDGYVTSAEAMTSNETSDDLWLQISHSDMWAADVFYFKNCYDRFVYFYKKIPKGNPLLNEEVSSKSAEKEFLV